MEFEWLPGRIPFRFHRNTVWCLSRHIRTPPRANLDVIELEQLGVGVLRSAFDVRPLPLWQSLTSLLSQTHSFALTGAGASVSPSGRENCEATPIARSTPSHHYSITPLLHPLQSRTRTSLRYATARQTRTTSPITHLRTRLRRGRPFPPPAAGRITLFS